ncbi:MAG TPA: hypothetical protein VE981_22110 [Planctomycetota bacterium]|nr:hypothetical protein [Planctomycetota bacterium]
MNSRGWRAAVHRAFVEYNPLYFASALCILAGVFLVARELPQDAFASKASIVASTEIYQFLLIAAAAVLLRAGLRRPAAILGLMCLVFMLDVAMNAERMLSHVGLLSLAPGMRARKAVPVSVLLALAGPLKLYFLAVVFRLRGARGPLVVTGLALLALPLLPYLTELVPPLRRQTVYLVMSWLGAPLLTWACLPAARSWTSGWIDDDQEPRLRRIAFVAPVLVACLFIAHGLTWSAIATLTPTAAQAAPYLLAVAGLLADRLAPRRPRLAELAAWVGGAATLGASALSDPTTELRPLALMSLLTGGVLVYLVEMKGLRLFLLAAACLFGGAYVVAAGAVAPLPLPGFAWPAGLAFTLLAGSIRHRDFRCLFVSALAAGATVAALRPGSIFLEYGGLLAGLWLAVACWLVFPGLRRWVPFAAAAAVLLLGGWMVWHEVPGIGLGYGAFAVASVGTGFALRRVEFHGAGVAAGSVLAGFRHGAWVPASSLGWGILLLAAGFVFLSAGVLVNLLLARRRPRVETPVP